MNFDGSSLTLRLVIEDEAERAMATLVESLSHAEVIGSYENLSMYDSHREPKLLAVEFTLTKPPVKLTSAPCSDCKYPGECERDRLCAYADRG